MRSVLKVSAWLMAALLCLLAGPLLLATSSSLQGAESWHTASRASAGIAPRPDQYQDAIVQVYGARAWSWRGYFAVHTWIATKEAGASDFLAFSAPGLPTLNFSQLGAVEQVLTNKLTLIQGPPGQ